MQTSEALSQACKPRYWQNIRDFPSKTAGVVVEPRIATSKVRRLLLGKHWDVAAAPVSHHRARTCAIISLMARITCDYRKLSPRVTGFFEGRCGFRFDGSSATVAMTIVPALQGVGVRDSRRRRCEQRNVRFSAEAKCRLQSSLLRQRLSGLALVPVVKSSDLRNHNDAPARFRFLDSGRPWPVRDEFGSAGSRPSNFVESDAIMIVDSKRLHGPNIRGE